MGEIILIRIELSKEGSHMQISDSYKNFEIAVVSLNFNLNFLLDDLGTIISAIFAAFTAAYIPMVFIWKYIDD